MQFEELSEPGLDISSLVDVAFLLLIYFLVTSTLQPKEGDLGLALPSDVPSNSPIKLDPMTISINEEGQIFLKEVLIESDVASRTLAALLAELKQYKQMCDATESKPIVVVAADDGAVHQRLVDVINTLSKVEITNITLTGFSQE